MPPPQLEPNTSQETIPDPEEEGEEEEEPPDEYTVFLTRDIAQCFELFDKNNTGEFEFIYLAKALKCLGITLTEFDKTDLVEVFDIPGLVTYPQFLSYALERLKGSRQHDILLEAFRGLDTEDEGLIPNDRLKRWLTTLGDPLTEKEAKEIIKLGDPNKRGYVDYESLIPLLLK